ncbi:MAG: septation regulator SpoVG [Firmicutes bacterium]|nr:septation regulator SpoVG [Bacillota bacterium]MDD4263497.1 septation regulator SpoVG [Bacillota bacterium]MDD4694286.1 septation regulator SpoVG [Bacillota bacterium]
MTITDVQVRKVDEAGRMKAIASITFNDAFVVRDIRVIEGNEGKFLAMPSRKLSSGEFRDVAHPVTAQMREEMTSLVLERLDALDA